MFVLITKVENKVHAFCKKNMFLTMVVEFAASFAVSFFGGMMLMGLMSVAKAMLITTLGSVGIGLLLGLWLDMGGAKK